MNKQHRSVILAALLGALGVAPACSDDDAQPNPSFSTGGKQTNAAGSPAAGDNGFGTGGDDTTPSVGGKSGTGGKSNGDAGASVTPQGGMAEDPGTAGAGGIPVVVDPPYDCVLKPKTHLEIINACTSAVRIEKHPVLPQIP